MTVKRLMPLALRHLGTSIGKSVRIIVCSTDTPTISCAVSVLSGTVLTLTEAILMGGIAACFAAGFTALCPLTVYSTCSPHPLTTTAHLSRFQVLDMHAEQGTELDTKALKETTPCTN